MNMPPSRVIFVDDEVSVLAGLRRHIELGSADASAVSADWDLHFVTSADAVLPLLEDTHAVVVSDWRMPGTTGLELLATIRERERTDDCKRCYFMLLTGLGHERQVVEALDAGADDFIAKPADPAVLAARIRVGLRVLAAEGQAREARERLLKLSRTDALTGLFNRRAIQNQLQAELSRVQRGHQDLSLLLIDVDHFKRVNDEHGHNAGDEVLREVSTRVADACRRYDVAGRWGGEEFLLLCPHAGPEDVLTVGERIRKVIADTPFSIGRDQELKVTVTVGVASAAEGQSFEPREFVRRADQALYAGKDAGRNRVVPFRWGSDAPRRAG